MALDVDSSVDFGDAGCGDLAIALMKAMRPLAPGQVLAVRALDPGASADVPAWCGMTGHTLLEVEPPRYVIKKKE